MDEERFNKFVESLFSASTDGMSQGEIELCQRYIRNAFNAQVALDEAYFKIHQTMCDECKSLKCHECDTMRVIKLIEKAQKR